MPQIKIKDKEITSYGNQPYVIAELGCNHCGDFGLCIQMIRKAKDCGADAVKLQKRNNRELFTRAALDAPYDSPNSYGKTYGAHRKALDWFGHSEFVKIRQLCNELDIAFICTPFTISDADFLNSADIRLDAIKIASCDLKNTPLIEHVARFGLPMLISTGGGEKEDIFRAMDAARPFDQNLAVLHCVSTYPNTDEHLNLASILMLNEAAPDAVVGFSSHHPSVLPHYQAYNLGARIFEVHFTLNRGFKGTDHGFSMEPSGLAKLCEDLKRISVMEGNVDRVLELEELSGFPIKMGKSIYASRDISAGESITGNNICLKAPATGLPPYLMKKIIGMKAMAKINEETPITRGSLIGEI